MIPAPAVVRLGGDARMLDYDPREHPLAAQLGGDDPRMLARASRILEDRGFDEVDLNLGCPSPRAATGNFGASLMADAPRVRECLIAMREAVQIPVTAKIRVGIDRQDSDAELERFVDQALLPAQVDRIIVHARKAWLDGLSPKENRTIPPLRHETVHALKARHPDVWIETNGGVKTIDDVLAHLEHVDGVMVGRAALDDPFFLAEADSRVFGEDTEPPTREQVLEAFRAHIEAMLAEGEPLVRVLRHAVDLFNGQPGARAWRRALSAGFQRRGGIEVLDQALAARADAIDRQATSQRLRAPTQH